MARLQIKTAMKTPASLTSTIFPNSNPASNSLMVILSGDDFGVVNQISGISDGTNTWARCSNGSTTDSGFVDTEMWFAVNSLTSTALITVTYAHSVQTGLVLAEYSGVSTSSPNDVGIAHTDNPGTLSHVSGNTASTAQADELVVSGMHWNNGVDTASSVTSGYSAITQDVNATSGIQVGLADKTVAAVGAQAATWATSQTDRAGVIVATFKNAAGGAVTNTLPSMGLMGIGM